MQLNKVFENKVPDFNSKITDEQSLEKAFDFVVDTIEQMAQLFISIGDIIGYKSLFLESTNDTYKKEFESVVNNIIGCGDKVNQVCEMINEYLCKGTVYNNYKKQEKTFDPQRAPIAVNKQINLAKTVVKDYNGKPSIEIPCQVFDSTIEIFNNSISVLNNQRELNVPHANQSNLITIFIEKEEEKE